MEFSSWLNLPNKDLWQYSVDAQGNMKCTGFGSTFKQVFRHMGMEILTTHKNLQFYGDLENSVRLCPRTNSISVNRPEKIPALTLEEGIEKDVKDYVKMFEQVCATNQPSWERNNLDLPPDVLYFRLVYVEFQKPMMHTTYDELRRREFWIFNYPGFLFLGSHQYFFDLVCDLRTGYKSTFDREISLKVGPNQNVLNNWANDRSRDTHGYFERAHSAHQNLIYKTHLGIVNFVSNLYHDFRDPLNPSRGNRIQLAQKIQSIYPDLMGMLHLEFCQTYKYWDPSLFDFLIAGEEREKGIPTWG